MKFQISLRAVCLALLVPVALSMGGCDNCGSLDCAPPNYSFLDLEIDLVDVSPNPRPFRVGTPPDDSTAGIWLAPEMGSSFTYTFDASQLERGRAELRVFHASPTNATSMPNDFFRLSFIERDSTGQSHSDVIYFEGGTRVLNIQEGGCCGGNIDAELFVNVFNHTFNERLTDDLQFSSGERYTLDDRPFFGGIVFGQ